MSHADLRPRELRDRPLGARSYRASGPRVSAPKAFDGIQCFEDLTRPGLSAVASRRHSEGL
jgi:hypothetical protein